MALDAARLAEAMRTLWTADGRNGFSSPLSTAQAEAVRAIVESFANAIVTEITTHAVVAVTTPGGDGTGTVS